MWPPKMFDDHTVSIIEIVIVIVASSIPSCHPYTLTSLGNAYPWGLAQMQHKYSTTVLRSSYQ